MKFVFRWMRSAAGFGVFRNFPGRAVLLAAVLALAAGCRSNDQDASKPTRIDDFDYTSIDNNHLTIRDFADHLVASGVPITQVQRLNPDVIKAIDAAEFQIEGEVIGVYQFNVNLKNQRELLEKYHDNGFVYFMAYRYPVFIGGSYLLIGAERHPRKKMIVAALRNFQ